ncbi:hypothetical protein EP331_15475 [bacterium]|nr:MAG: hypothetical protein EP331_15475 [bacterium]
MKFLFLSYFLFLFPIASRAQLLPGFQETGIFHEQQLVLEDSTSKTRILINAPFSGFQEHNQVMLVLYALPNGNSIEQTKGKKTNPGDDWHFDIQHIAAQTRFIRSVLSEKTVVVAYLENTYKSWPLWKRETPDYLRKTNEMVKYISQLFENWSPEIVLNGHSGGGRFLFNYLESVDEIPEIVTRISFLDSDYGYEDSTHGSKLNNWLHSGTNKFLTVLAYNDSVVVYNGKPLVSPTGGTWYRTKLMKSYLSQSFNFIEVNQDSLLWYKSANNTISFVLKTNPEGKIYHTVQVERNGFIHSILAGTAYEEKGYRYFGERAYSEFMSDSVGVQKR